MTRDHTAAMIEGLEVRRLLAAGATATQIADVQHMFKGNVNLEQPLTIQTRPNRHTTVRRLAFTLSVSSEAGDGTIAGTMSIGRFGDAAFTGVVGAKSLQITFTTAAGEHGTLIGTANAGGTRVNGQLNGVFNATDLVGTAHAIAAPAASTSPAAASSAPTGGSVPPNFSNGIFAGMPLTGGGFIQPGAGGFTPVTGMVIPSNGFAQPPVFAQPPLPISSTTGAILPSTGFVAAISIGSDGTSGFFVF